MFFLSVSAQVAQQASCLWLSRLHFEGLQFWRAMIIMIKPSDSRVGSPSVRAIPRLFTATEKGLQMVTIWLQYAYHMLQYCRSCISKGASFYSLASPLKTSPFMARAWHSGVLHISVGGTDLQTCGMRLSGATFFASHSCEAEIWAVNIRAAYLLKTMVHLPTKFAVVHLVGVLKISTGLRKA